MRLEAIKLIFFQPRARTDLKLSNSSTEHSQYVFDQVPNHIMSEFKTSKDEKVVEADDEPDDW